MNPIKRALISVSDKSGVAEFARQLHGLGVEILSTGGTAKLLADAGIPVIEVSDYTGFPEMMDGRVKTLHPKIHGGILGRRGVDDGVMREHAIPGIDLVVVNLYPFEQTVAKPGCDLPTAIENIDIGGPTLLRAAAKNHASVTVVVDAEDGSFPRTLNLQFRRVQSMRYGENPHQSAAFYVEHKTADASVATARQLQGKELSYNNVADTDAALECVKTFSDGPACVIVKHANPCGVAYGANLLEAYDRAYQTDPESAFGGIIAFNGELDAVTAQAIAERQFVEVIIAPEVSAAALEVLAAKKNVRVLACGHWSQTPTPRRDFKRVTGGLLVQDADLALTADIRVVTKRAPTDKQMQDLLFAWRVAKFVKSNAIVYAKDAMTIGVGAGQMSRVNSARIAGIKAEHAGLDVKGSVMASDAFFPFRDGIDQAAAAGIAAVIQPGGSMRDEEVIAAADEHGMAMVFTGMRHFRH